ncbi:high-affinity glucose transporter [Microdochium bolleyi]|uniref:High-affinity glucose transporter n=1 Tax=Microdochium bolleyi TaxID=196109 RepID=A0A136J0X8_9PEZI|nr:high-affinity glucose transporter [Microdochium bolleyi]
MKKFGNIYFLAAIAVIGGALFGFDISSMSAIISTEPYKCQFNREPYFDEQGRCYGPSDTVQGGITAAMPGGSWAGALVSGWLTDRFGRKTSIQIGSIIWVLGCIITCASVNIPMLIVGRVICGFSVGICSAQVPVYISEQAPPSKRGRLIGMQQWAITWGIAIMYFICYGCSFLEHDAAFRVPWGVQAFPAFILGIGLMFLPESPRWLAKKDRWEECKEVLILVHGKGDPNSPFAAKELHEIQEVVEFERRNADVSIFELFKPKMINRTHIGVFTQIWSQLTGMNVMMYYITYIFTMAGLGEQTLLSSGIQFIINVVMTVPALIWMDTWGRRPSFLVGAFLMCLWCCINAGLFAVYSRPANPGEFTNPSISMVISGPASKAVIASTYLFVASFAPTWGPSSWAYPSELYPQRVRGKAVALATSSNWAFNFALAFFVPPAFATITWRTYILFAVFCFCMFWHVFFVFPETANKSLEEVALIFEDNGPGSIKNIGTPAWKTRNERHRTLKAERNEVDVEEKLAAEPRVSKSSN